MLQKVTNEISVLVQAIVWCCRIRSHYLSQWWPRSMLPSDVTRTQWINQFNAMEWNHFCVPTLWRKWCRNCNMPNNHSLLNICFMERGYGFIAINDAIINQWHNALLLCTVFIPTDSILLITVRGILPSQMAFLYPRFNEVEREVYLFHLVHLELCLLCIFNNTCWVNFIFTI